MSPITYLAAALLLASCACADNSTAADTDSCGAQPEGPWSAALEDWVTAERVTVGRHGRIMALPPTQGYYVSDRIDLMPPPPPPYQHGAHHMHHRGPYPVHHPPGNRGPPVDRGPSEAHSSRLQAPPGPTPPAAPQSYDEWQATPPPPPGAGKIVNRPPNPYKDQFKPSYAPPSPPQRPIPVQGLADEQRPTPVQGLADRADEQRPAPHKQVSETDLYLLGAIEKLVYRVDLMEKRLRKMEENVHYLVAGAEPKPEPCPGNFTRLGGGCYHVSSDALNWKNANYACRKLRAHLLELEGDERRRFTAAALSDPALKGSDFWTGGLNPGLLWIWSHSAKAVANATGGNSTDTGTVGGEGRCLALVHAPATAAYVYRGQDCALRHRYVCEQEQDAAALGNEIERVARALSAARRIPKMKWTEGDST